MSDLLTPGLRYGQGQGLHRRLASEQGIALTISVLFVFVIVLLAAALASAALSAGGQSRRDRSTKRAVAAADAGLDTALYRLNKLRPDELMCVVVGANGLVLEPVQPDGWCRAQTEDLGEGASYSYRVSGASLVTVNNRELLQRRVLSTGTVNGVKRRALTVVGSSTGKSLFGGNAVTSLTDLTIPNSSSIQGNAASNGNVSLRDSAQLCGYATVGPGKQFTTTSPSLQCAGYGSLVAQEPFVLNPVDQGNAATVNDNGRIGVQDTFAPSVPSIWNPATRVLQLKQYSTLILTGNVYSFCNLEIANQAQLIIGARLPTQPPLKIYIDSPENCPGVTNAGSVKLTEQAGIVNLNADPSTVRLYLLGSPQTPTRVDFLNSFQSDVNLFVYAPRSTVRLQNSTKIVGAVAAQSVLLENSAQVRWSPSASVTIDDLAPLFRRQSWIECRTGQTAPVPDSGC